MPDNVAEDLLHQVARIQRYTSGLAGLLAEAEDMAPAEAEGADSTGSVRVRVGADGLPVAFHVAQDWNRKLQPDAFGPAVVDACQAAVEKRLQEWTNSLADGGWQDKVDRLKDDQTSRLPDEWRQMMAKTKPRPAEQLVEDVLKAFDNIDLLTPAPPPPASGSAAGGMLTLAISSTGVTSCGAEPRWVAAQSAAALIRHLDTALDRARADLDAESRHPEPDPAGGIDQLIAEALSLLQDPGRRT